MPDPEDYQNNTHNTQASVVHNRGQLFELLSEHIHDVIFTLDLEFHYTYISPSVEKMGGFRPDVVLNKPLSASLTPASYKQAMQAAKEEMELERKGSANPNRSRILELELLKKDGSTIWTEVKVSFIRDEKLQAVGILGVTRDITERKLARERLVQFKAAFENTFDAITLRALKEDKLIDCNKRALEMFGLSSKEEFLHKHPSQFSPPCQPDGRKSEERSRELIIELIKKGGSVNFEFLHQRKDGSLFFGDITLTAYHLWDDIILQANIRDITTRKQTEQEMANYTLELEQLYHHLDKEIERALHVHERILPKTLPRVKGISCASHYQPAQRLGGDFYNVIKAGNKLVIYLSDVSGHGLDGAMLSVFIKEAIHSYLYLKPEHIHPEKILHHLDSQFRREDYPSEYLVCIFLAVLDLETMDLSFAAAGFHDTPFVCMGNGERLKLNSRGLPITTTVAPELMSFEVGLVRLTPGTTILFTTDGLTEQKSGETIYIKRLERVFYDNCKLPPELIVQAINEDFRQFMGGSQQGDDDITLLVLQADPEPD